MPRAFLAAAPLVVLVACSQPPRMEPLVEGPAPADAFRRACASCHGVDGRGDGPVAPSLGTRPPDLTTLAARNGGTFPREDVRAIVTGLRDVPAHGPREMPIWSERFEPTMSAATGIAAAAAQRRLEAILDYVASIQRPASHPAR